MLGKINSRLTNCNSDKGEYLQIIFARKERYKINDIFNCISGKFFIGQKIGDR